MSNYIEGIKLAYSGLAVTLQISAGGVILGVSIGLIIAMIMEQGTPHEIFNEPKNERTKNFLSKIL